MLVALITLALSIVVVARPLILGIGGAGPEHSVETTVTRLYVDHSGSGEHAQSHYMVGTEDGVFEVDNGILLGCWNADEIFARLREGRRYQLRTKGNRVVGYFYQEYPYIIAAREVTVSPNIEAIR